MTNNNNVYPAESAGRLMSLLVPVVLESATLKDAREALEDHARNFDTMPYVYVIGNMGHLVGVISLRDIFGGNEHDPVMKYTPVKLATVRPYTDQEHVALLALHRGIKAVPVVDREGKLMGVVGGDAILRILHEEANEDIGRFGGMGKGAMTDDIFKLSIKTSLWHRLPWLVCGLFGGLLAAGIVRGFEDVLARNIILAAFIPLIVYMADAVGTQMEAFIIRDLSVKPSLSFKNYFVRQATIVSIIAFIVSFLLFFLSLSWYQNQLVSLVLSIALFVAIMSSLLSGLTITFIFHKLKFDPANASGPIATIIQDLLSVLVYFGVASLVL